MAYTFPPHEDGLVCPGCEARLLLAHPYMQGFFHAIKPEFVDTHIAWSYRDEKQQNDDFYHGRSKLRWPFSRHNRMDRDGNPKAEALDLFQQVNGCGIWDPGNNARIYKRATEMGFEINWGGHFKSLGDSGHFEAKPQALSTEDDPR